MKKLSLLLLMAFSMTIMIQAQAPNGQCTGKHKGKTTEFKMMSPEERAEKSVQRMAEKLNLSAEQASEIKQLKLTSFEKSEVIKAPYKSTLDKMHEEMKALKESQPESGDEGIDKKDRSAFKAVKDKYKTELEPMHKAMKSQRDQLDEQIVVLLNVDQKKTFEEMKKNHKSDKKCDKKRERTNH